MTLRMSPLRVLPSALASSSKVVSSSPENRTPTTWEFFMLLFVFVCNTIT